MISLESKNTVINELNNIKKITRIFSLIRLTLVLTLIVLFVCFITLENYILFLILCVLSILLLMGIIFISSPYFEKEKQLKNLIKVYDKHKNRRNNSYKTFSPDGKEYIDYTDYKQLDLDLLGPKSLFQYLCCAKSKMGRINLAKQLTNPCKKDNDFTKCVNNFADNPETLRVEAAINQIANESKECDYEELFTLLRSKINIAKIGIIFMIFSYVILLLTTVVLVINKQPIYYLSIFLLINFIAAKHFFRSDVFKINSTKYSNCLSSYVTLIKEISSININDFYFMKIKNTLNKELENLEKTCKVLELLSYRNNVILSILGNGFIYFDFIVAKIFNRNTVNIDSINNIFELIAELEVVVSLSIIGLDNEVYSMPIFSDEFMIVDGYHPLVKKCIPNSLNFDRNIILTGSNMSGKTTFMRMLGVNQILANAGGIVCAKEFKTKDYVICTSLRANDMLQEGISTFYAEINRMQKIVNLSENNGKKTLVLVDEIFKGTNAKDRIFSSFEVIKKLNNFDVKFIITTHDFELCEAPNIENYHFNEKYVDNNIEFDFKIKSGISTTSNAVYLLKMAGVLDK